MRRNKWLIILAGTLLLCTLAFTSFSPSNAMAATHTQYDSTPCLHYVGLGHETSGIYVSVLQYDLNQALIAHDDFHTNALFPFHTPLDEFHGFGPETYNALRDFQIKQGLSVDGIAGPHTWDKFGYNCQAFF
jgi:hypothetical protein